MYEYVKIVLVYLISDDIKKAYSSPTLSYPANLGL
jgi:hypothetical protein